MAVYIKGMEMPLNCTRCACSDDGSRYCRAANEYIPMLGKPKFCPLVEIKEPHGDLVDSKYIIDQLDKVDFDTYYVYSCVFDIIDKAPTIIERSEDDER